MDFGWWTNWWRWLVQWLIGRWRSWWWLWLEKLCCLSWWFDRICCCFLLDWCFHLTQVGWRSYWFWFLYFHLFFCWLWCCCRWWIWRRPRRRLGFEEFHLLLRLRLAYKIMILLSGWHRLKWDCLFFSQFFVCILMNSRRLSLIRNCRTLFWYW